MLHLLFSDKLQMINGVEEALPQQSSASMAIHIWISGPVVLVLSWSLYNGPQCRDGRVNSYDHSMKTSAKTCESPVATK
ncbi:hypothetical protein QYF36_009686 [Acer negundo]|nr:hypothetical protein QYF36_009686 [Acer negundo]